MKKRINLMVFLVVALVLAGCQRTITGNDVADKGLNAFNNIVSTYPENKGFHSALQHWGFALPTGEKFEWSKDMSANKADFAMVLLADPLVEAGLDIEKLDKDVWLYEPAGTDDMGEEMPNRLIKPYNVSDKKEVGNGSEDSMRRLLKADTSMIKYNEEQKNYSLFFGNNNEVQWTEELGTNDADMIFVLEAKPLVDAGLDIDKLDGSGWTFSEDSDQIVKVFDIKK